MDYSQCIVEKSGLIFGFNLDTDAFGLLRHGWIIVGLLIQSREKLRDGADSDLPQLQVAPPPVLHNTQQD